MTTFCWLNRLASSVKRFVWTEAISTEWPNQELFDRKPVESPAKAWGKTSRAVENRKRLAGLIDVGLMGLA